MERLGLDRRFCIEFVTRLTWTSAPAHQPDQLSRSPPQQGGFFQSLPFGLGGGSGQDDATLGRVKVSLAPAACMVSTWRGSAVVPMQSRRGMLRWPISVRPLLHGEFETATDGENKTCLSLLLMLQGESELQVYSEVIGPFNLMPRAVLQGGGSAVMSALVRTLLPLFMRR